MSDPTAPMVADGSQRAPKLPCSTPHIATMVLSIAVLRAITLPGFIPVQIVSDESASEKPARGILHYCRSLNGFNRFSTLFNGAPGMTRNYGLRMLAVAALCYGVISVAQNVPGGDTKSTADGLILSQSLPPMKGDELKITVLEVAYAPGAASPAHCHPCPVVHTNCLTCCPRTPTRSAPTRHRNLD